MREHLRHGAALVAGWSRFGRSRTVEPRDGAVRARGTVVLPFGRYFAARADLLTRDGFKTVVPIDGVSPFTAVEELDPEMQHLAVGERVNDRVKADVLKDLATRMADAAADVLVIDNSSALLFHREVNGRLYTVVPGEDTALTDVLWNSDVQGAREVAFKVSHRGLTDQMRARYDAFIRACLASFDPEKIILVRSHAARFSVSARGKVRTTDLDRRDADLLDALDDCFIARTGCRVSAAALAQPPESNQWQSFDRERLRRAIEDDVVRLCTSGQDDVAVTSAAVAARRALGGATAADHVVLASRGRGPVDEAGLTGYFAAGGASFDDLLALVHLKQRFRGRYDELIRRCVTLAVADPGSYPAAVTRHRFEQSVQALYRWPWGPFGGLRSGRPDSIVTSVRGWRWGSLPGAPTEHGASRGKPRTVLDALRGVVRGVRHPSPARFWTPQVAVPCGAVVVRFLPGGTIRSVHLEKIAPEDVAAVIEGRLPVTPLNLLDAWGSWPLHLERGRRGITEALRVVLSDVGELVDTCVWLDWATLLHDERVVITTRSPSSVPARRPEARTNLAFVFEPTTRIGTVGGGLADQVTHLALFDELCRPHGLTLYIDDMRYTWWRSHNGFEASRLGPAVDARRITRLVSRELVERFRAEVVKVRLPWVYSQSQAWHELGLREALVVTQDHPNSRRLMQIGPRFPVRVYLEPEELADLVRDPPRPVTFFTTQQRIAIEPDSATALRRIFSFRHLDAEGLDPGVALVADLLRHRPHVAFHVRRGDYLHPHFDTGGWHARQDHYAKAVDLLAGTELGASGFDVAVFSDDLEFVEAHLADYGLDRVTGQVRFIRGNHHFAAIYDSYLMSLCPVIVGSVGFFAATTSLLADPPSTFVRARPEGISVEWRR